MFKKKKNLAMDLSIVLIPCLLIICMLGYSLLKDVKNMIPQDNVVVEKDTHNINDYDYHLKDDATEFQLNKFTELKTEIEKEESEKDDLKIASLIVENFVSDMYTWTNKKGSYDMGGLYYVYSPSRLIIKEENENTLYLNLGNYIKEYGQENLLEVTSVTATAKENGQIELNGEKYDAFHVDCEWTYKESSVFNTNDFVDKQYFSLIKLPTGRFEIYEQFGDANE